MLETLSKPELIALVLKERERAEELLRSKLELRRDFTFTKASNENHTRTT